MYIEYILSFRPVAEAVIGAARLSRLAAAKMVWLTAGPDQQPTAKQRRLDGFGRCFRLSKVFQGLSASLPDGNIDRKFE